MTVIKHNLVIWPWSSGSFGHDAAVSALRANSIILQLFHPISRRVYSIIVSMNVALVDTSSSRHYFRSHFFQNGILSDGMDQHMRNLNPSLKTNNQSNYGLQDGSALSSIQMLRPQQSQHQDFIQHHQSSLLMSTGKNLLLIRLF